MKTQKDLKTLVILDHVLAGERFRGFASHLSPADRAQARVVLENRQSQLRQHLINVLESAYGVDDRYTGSLDTTYPLDGHVHSLDAELRPSPPVSAHLAGAFHHLLDQALDPTVAVEWAAAAEEVVRGTLGDRAVATPWLERAEALLDGLGARDHAAHSALLPAGLTQRLEAWGQSLTAALEDPAIAAGSSELEAAARAVTEHELARGEANVPAVHMALRLVRWLAAHTASPPEPPASFAAAVAATPTPAASSTGPAPRSGTRARPAPSARRTPP